MAQLDDAEIRARIKQARKEAGLSQTEMAELLGVIARTVQNYENDHVPWGRIRDIAEITAKPTRWLLHGDDAGDTEQAAEIQRALGQLESRLDQIWDLLSAEAPGAGEDPPGEVVADVAARLAKAAGSPPRKARGARRTPPGAKRRRSA